jgi:hypothetical protein
MPTRFFVFGPNGAEIPVTPDNQGTEQTCTSCSAVIARQEPAGDISGTPRFVGQVQVAVIIPPVGDGPGHLHQSTIPFELCATCGSKSLGPFGVVVVDEPAAADDDEHQDHEPAADHVDQRSLMCKTYGANHHSPCSGTTDYAPAEPCVCWCHADAAADVDEHPDKQTAAATVR